MLLRVLPFICHQTVSLTQSQVLLNSEDFVSAMICVTLYLSSLLCGVSRTSKSLVNSCGPLQCRLLKLVHAWDNQPLVPEIRDKSSEIMEIISQSEQDSDFTPTVDRFYTHCGENVHSFRTIW